MILRAIKAPRTSTLVDKAEEISRYTTTMAFDPHLMLKAGKGKERQSIAAFALKPNEFVPVSRYLGVMVGGAPYMLFAGAWLFNHTAHPCKPQRMFVCARGEQDTLLPVFIREAEQRLQTLRLETVMRRRGVPRRGGRSGVRVVRDEEEPHPIAPMAARYPSSTSSEEEFLFVPNSYQSFRLRIPRRDLQTDVIVNLSVYLSEAAPISPSWSSPASASADLQGSEILMGDMNGRVYRMARPLAADVPADPPQTAPDLDDAFRDVSVQEFLPLRDRDQNRIEGQDSVHPDSDGQQQDAEESVIWLDPPSPVQRQPPGSPNHLT